MKKTKLKAHERSQVTRRHANTGTKSTLYAQEADVERLRSRVPRTDLLCTKNPGSVWGIGLRQSGLGPWDQRGNDCWNPWEMWPEPATGQQKRRKVEKRPQRLPGCPFARTRWRQGRKNSVISPMFLTWVCLRAPENARRGTGPWECGEEGKGSGDWF